MTRRDRSVRCAVLGLCVLVGLLGPGCDLFGGGSEDDAGTSDDLGSGDGDDGPGPDDGDDGPAPDTTDPDDATGLDATGPDDTAEPVETVDPPEDADPLDDTDPGGGSDKATRCNPNAMVPELCSPDGEGTALNVELDVVYANPAKPFPRYQLPFNTAEFGKCRDLFEVEVNEPLRVYRARMQGEDEWMAPDFPGPTLRLKIGDTLNLQYSNSLDASDGAPPTHDDGCVATGPATDKAPNCFHGYNVTNIHFHGSHVTPDTNGLTGPEFRLSDNVFVKALPANTMMEANPDEWVYPGDAVPPYQLTFGEGQIPGTHWYHAHKHGSTALHMLNGQAGALIIEGDFEGVSEIEHANERVMVMQQIDNRPLKLTAGPAAAFQEPPPPVINGVFVPTFEMKSGEVQRWRFISATQQASASFKGMKLEGHPEFEQPEGACVDGVPDPAVFDYTEPGVYQIAQDGIEFLDPQWQQVLCNKDAFLDQPFDSGNRADFLIVAPKTDVDLELILTTDRAIVKPVGGGGSQGGGPGIGGSDEEVCAPEPLPETYLIPGSDTPLPVGVPVLGEVPLLKVLVKAHDATSPPPVSALPKHVRTFEELPPGMQAALAPIEDEELIGTRTIEFAMNPSQTNAPHFYIGCKKFCEDRLDHCMALNTAEEWKITNYTTVSHPFHIHINPFHITHWFDAKAYYEEKVDPECESDCELKHDPSLPLPADAGLLGPDDVLSRWQDTIGLPKAFIPDVFVPEVGPPQVPPVIEGFVKVRQRYLDFSGDFVIHCHILGHEDRGMMQRIGTRDSGAQCDSALQALDGSACDAPSTCCIDCMSSSVDPNAQSLPPTCGIPDPTADGGIKRGCYDADNPEPPAND